MRNMNWVVKLFVVLFSFFAVSACFGSMPSEDSVFADKTPEGQITQLSDETFNDFELSPDGKTIAVGTETGTYVFSGEQFGLIAKISLPAQSLAFHPNGNTLAIGYDDDIWLWDIQNDVFTFFVKTAWKSLDRWMGEMMFSPDGQTLAIHTYVYEDCDPFGKNAFQLRSVNEKGMLIFQAKTCAFWVSPLFNFSKDGDKLILGFDNIDEPGFSSSVFVIDPHSGELLQNFPNVYMFGASSDGRTLALEDDNANESTRWFDLETQQFSDPSQWEQPRSDYFWVFSPDQKHFVGVEEETLYLFEIATGKKVCTFEGLEFHSIWWPSFDEKGKRVLFWNLETNHVSLWELPQCKQIQSWQMQGSVLK